MTRTATASRHSATVLSALMCLLFGVGWWVTRDRFEAQAGYYLALHVLNLAAALAMVRVMAGEGRRLLHLWIIFWLYAIGYFLKFHLLTYMSLHLDVYDQALRGSYPLEAPYFEDPVMLMSYLELASAAWVTFAVVVLAIGRGGASGRVDAPALGLHSTRPALVAIRLHWVFLAVLGLSFLLFAVEIWTGVGLNEGTTREQEPLPFRLAGVIMAVHRGLLPLLYMLLIWLTQELGLSSLNRKATVGFLVFGVVWGLLSTSKSALTIVLTSLYVLWFLTDRLDRRRVMALFVAIPVLTAFNVFLSINRILRNLDFNQDVWTIFSLAAQQWDANASGGDNAPLIGYLGLVLRINGVDTMLNLMDYDMQWSVARAWDFLAGSGPGIASFYGTEVLGLTSEFGVAFSPSLLGTFYVLGGHLALVCFLLAMFVWGAHILFRTLGWARMRIEPIVLAVLSIQLALLVSEGTLEVVPQRLAIIGVTAVCGEWLLTRLLGTAPLASPQATPPTPALVTSEKP